MTPVKFGVLTHSQIYEAGKLEEIVLAERLGFDSAWVGERHIGVRPAPAPLIYLAVMAGRTEKLRLGTGAMVYGGHPLGPDYLATDFDFQRCCGPRYIMGNPEDCRRQVQEYLDMGVNHIIIRVHPHGMPIEVSDRMMTLFAQEVIPHLATRPGDSLP